MRKKSKSWILLAILFASALLSIAQNRALAVPAGFDLFETDPDQTAFNFPPGMIPPSFFDPGSDPFQGIVCFGGDPLVNFMGEYVHGTDTIVQRMAPANLPSVPSTDTVPIELVQLSLVSCQPITVTYNGGMNPEQWNVAAGLSSTRPSNGTMTITKSHPNGGTFDAELWVMPLFIFTRPSDNAMRNFDIGQQLPPGQEQLVALRTTGAPWVHTCPTGTLQIPTLNPDFCASATATDRELTVLVAPLVIHGIRPAGEPHWKCYNIQPKVSPGVAVSLRDQFLNETDISVGLPQLLCPPVSKLVTDSPTAVPPPPPTGPHLKCYDIPPTQLQNTRVNLTDQFGTQSNVQVRQSELLCVPVSKTPLGTIPPLPPNNPHVKCYNIASTVSANVRVNLRDQFHNETGVTVTTPQLLCNPVSKAQAGVLPPPPPNSPHVKCYDIQPKVAPMALVNLRDQFHEELDVTVGDPAYLCVHVRKTVLPPLPTTPITPAVILLIALTTTTIAILRKLTRKP